MTKKVLFVCLGNICRSPTAHAVMRHKIAAMPGFIEIESAGTSASHRGEKPDPRAVREGMQLGYQFSDIVSRPVQDADFSYYDLILAMDNDNLKQLQSRCPAQWQHKIQLFLQYHPQYPELQEVPDPYYGGSRGFALVLQMIEQGCDGLLRHLKQQDS
ncbi:low molecular weight protein-tyrosine-phosphatase [Rheinheimera aquimaris]|uniref:low molecular weight protein-tyrosine-phosphatase n=1 Tax=Rheinheimera aquimaris TaxID=412437 RepID=UPI003A97D544